MSERTRAIAIDESARRAAIVRGVSVLVGVQLLILVVVLDGLVR